jgi:hypothetical protein
MKSGATPLNQTFARTASSSAGGQRSGTPAARSFRNGDPGSLPLVGEARYSSGSVVNSSG